MMNWIISGLVVIALAVGGYMFLGDTNKAMMEVDSTEDEAMMEKDAMMQKDDAMMQKDSPAQTGDGAMMEKETMMTKGSYEVYAPEKLAKASSGDVVLFFRASWCPTCKVLDADIRARLNTIPSNLTILDVNYDTETALKQKYGVTYQHTLVQVDAQGNQITKWSGGQTLASVVANVQ